MPCSICTAVAAVASGSSAARTLAECAVSAALLAARPDSLYRVALCIAIRRRLARPNEAVMPFLADECQVTASFTRLASADSYDPPGLLGRRPRMWRGRGRVPPRGIPETT
jgi:hypothetical protein